VTERQHTTELASIASSGTKPDGVGETPPFVSRQQGIPPSTGQTAAPAYLALIEALTTLNVPLTPTEGDFPFDVRHEPSSLPVFHVNAGGGHAPSSLDGQMCQT
jgi:hypothetical protein